jgi:hypothetical protein
MHMVYLEKPVPDTLLSGVSGAVITVQNITNILFYIRLLSLLAPQEPRHLKKSSSIVLMRPCSKPECSDTDRT